MKILVLDNKNRFDPKRLVEAGHEVHSFADDGKVAEVIREGEHFDAALVDFFIPAEEMTSRKKAQCQKCSDEHGINFSLGIMLALSGVKKVVVVEDMKRCSYPSSPIAKWDSAEEMRMYNSKIYFVCAVNLAEKGVWDWTPTVDRFLN